MKIDYPQIDREDAQPGDTILMHWSHNNIHHYREFTVNEQGVWAHSEGTVYYLIDRPKPVFPEDYGTVIIAKKVRGIDFPEGIVLTRQRGSRYEYGPQQNMWKSIDRRVDGKDNHGERQIEDWVLAKVVPA